MGVIEIDHPVRVPQEPLAARPVANLKGLPIVRKWMPVIVKFASVQGIVQVVGFAAGILIVRNLSKQEYAFYTIGNTMLATILLLADGGVSSALSAIGGRVYQDDHRLGSLINTALQLRRWMAAVTVVLVVPVLVWLLSRNGAAPSATSALVIAVLIGCGFELITRIYAVVLRLRSEIRQIQNQALVGALIKLAIVGVFLFVFFNATIAILAVVAGYAVQYWMLRQWVHQKVDRDAPEDPEMRSEMLNVVRRQVPHSIYYCLQGQITVWLISIFGTSESVANVGALGRLAVVFSILGSVTCEIVFPAFARIESLRQVRRRYWQIILGYSFASSLLLAVVALFPRQVLSVLGSQYIHLQTEGVLMAVSSVLVSIAGVIWGLNSARAWIVSPWAYLPVTLAIQVILVSVFRLSTVKGVLLFSIFSVIPGMIWAVWHGFRSMAIPSQLTVHRI